MRIGFIGVGAMGKPMAQNLIKAAHDVYIYDINQAVVAELASRGGLTAATPKEAASRAEIVITMLPNAAIVEDTMTADNGILAGGNPGLTIVDMSSVAPRTSLKMAALAKQRGFQYADAPVSGGVAGADAGTLTIMVGAEPDTFRQIEPVLQILGKKIYHVGPVGSGDAIKVVNNLLLGVHMAAAAEALVLGAKAGLNPEVMLEIIKESSGRSYALEAKAANFIFKGNFTPGFAIDLQYKDLELAVETGKNLGVPLPVGNLAQQIFEMSRAKGLGREDISAVIKVWEELTGVQVRTG
ncbi:MAG: NAD(P)-dependent oxidoreductase [Negativicutes bacterium]|nr:NAD(P)-dependent oxidoreductase [Negativicutes bacterium]